MSKYDSYHLPKYIQSLNVYSVIILLPQQNLCEIPYCLPGKQVCLAKEFRPPKSLSFK